MHRALIAMLAGTVVLLASIDENASAEIVTASLLLAPWIGGLGLPTSQPHRVPCPTSSARRSDAGQTTATNIGASLRTALAGRLARAGLGASLLQAVAVGVIGGALIAFEALGH